MSRVARKYSDLMMLTFAVLCLAVNSKMFFERSFFDYNFLLGVITVIIGVLIVVALLSVLFAWLGWRCIQGTKAVRI